MTLNKELDDFAEFIDKQAISEENRKMIIEAICLLKRVIEVEKYEYQDD